MDEATLKKLGAIPKEFTINFSRKVSDGDYGSVGGEFWLTCELAQGAELEVAMNATFEYVKQKAVENLKPSFENVRTQLHVPPEAYEEPRYEPIVEGHEDAETELMPVEIFRVSFSQKDGSRFLKVCGGKWKKYGVTCWPEVYHQLGVHISELEGADYPLSQFNLMPNLQAVVLMEEGKPKKVVGWKK